MLIKLKLKLIFPVFIVLAILATSATAANKNKKQNKKSVAEKNDPQPPQSVPGNIFLDTEPVVIQYLAEGASVSYTVKDFWGQEVASGSTPVTDGISSIRPDIKKRGFFEIRIKTEKKTKVMTFAIIAPVNMKDRADSPFGAQTHFGKGWDTDIIPILSRMGISHVRDEQPWAQVEKEKGKLAFTFVNNKGETVDRLLKYMAALKSADITPLIVLAFGNKHYPPGGAPYLAAPFNEEGYNGYATYCTEVVKQFGSQIKCVEIWNEYNGSFCKGPAAKDRPKFYTEMCKNAYEAIKNTDPDIKVIGCAPVLFPLPYMEGIFKNGGLNYMDGVVIHPYRPSPNGLDRELLELNSLIKKYNNGKTKPIWATEYGWGEWNAETLENIGNYLVRSSVLMLSQGVERMYWYLMKDFESFKTMGLVHAENDSRGKYSPAPACPAMATMIRLLAQAKYEEREANRPYTRVNVFRFKAGAEELRVCWGNGEKCQVTVLTDAPLTKVDIMGNETKLVSKSGKLDLVLDDTPFYLKGKINSISEPQGEWTPIANNAEDSATVQGENGWTFGCYPGTKGPAPDSKPVAAFKEMNMEVTIWGYEWNGPEKSKIKQQKMVPQTKEWPAMRWISKVDGKVEVMGNFSLRSGKKAPSDGAECVIYVNGKSVFTKTIKPVEVNRTFMEKFDVGVEIKKGAVIDFAVTPGPSGNPQGDQVQLDASICLPNQKH